MNKENMDFFSKCRAHFRFSTYVDIRASEATEAKFWDNLNKGQFEKVVTMIQQVINLASFCHQTFAPK